MPTKKYEKGEQLGFGIKSFVEGGHAVGVTELSRARKSASEAVGSVQRRVANRELEAAKNSCRFGGVCGLTVEFTEGADGQSPEVVFICPRASEACGDLVSRAAEDTDKQLSLIPSQVADKIGQLGP